MRVESTLKVRRAYLFSLPSTSSRPTNTLAPMFSIGIEQRSYIQLPSPGRKNSAVTLVISYNIANSQSGCTTIAAAAWPDFRTQLPGDLVRGQVS